MLELHFRHLIAINRGTIPSISGHFPKRKTLTSPRPLQVNSKEPMGSSAGTRQDAHVVSGELARARGRDAFRHSPKFQEYVPKIQNILRIIFQTYEAKQSEDDDSPVDLGYTYIYIYYRLISIYIYILQKGMFASDDGKMQPEWTWEWQPTDYLINT